MPETKDPVRDAYTRISRILERLEPADRQRIHDALGMLFGMTTPKGG
jgi:hypothetical protein